MRARLVLMSVLVCFAGVLTSQNSVAKPSVSKTAAPVLASDAKDGSFERLAESLRVTLGQLAPTYHALLLEGQLPGADCNSPIPPAVQAAWLKLAQDVSQAPLHGTLRAKDHADWSERFDHALGALSHVQRLGDVLSASQNVLIAAQNLAYVAHAGLALSARSENGNASIRPPATFAALPERLRPRNVAPLTLAAQQRDPQAPAHAMLWAPALDASTKNLTMALVAEHLDGVARLLGQLAAPPLAIGHDLHAAWVEHSGGDMHLVVRWTPPGPSHLAPARVRLYRHQNMASTRAQALAMAGCLALNTSQRDAFVATALQRVDEGFALLAELPRSANLFQNMHSRAEAEVPAEVALAAVSAFGVEGRRKVVAVVQPSTGMMPPVGVSAETLAPTLDDPNFYRGLDAVVVRWQPTVLPQAATDFAAKPIRYDIYRFAAADAALQTSDLQPFHGDLLAPMRTHDKLPDAREFVASVPPTATSYVDRPGPEVLRQGQRYGVVAVDANETVTMAPWPCALSGTVQRDVRQALDLARQGGDRLTHPTAYEQAHAQTLQSPGAKLLSQRLFLALPEPLQRRLWQQFWDRTSFQKKHAWRDDWNALLGEEGRKKALVDTVSHLAPETLAWARLDRFAAEHPALAQAAEQHWALTDLATRREALRHWLKQGWVAHRISQKGEPPEDTRAMRLWHWTRLWDAEDHEAVETWWAHLSEQQHHALITQWLTSLSAEAQAHVAWPAWQQMTPQQQSAFVSEAPSFVPEGLWPSFLARQAFDELSITKKREIVMREVPPLTRAWARVRYAVRPIDVWIDFQRTAALALILAGFGVGWLLFMLVTSEDEDDQDTGGPLHPF